MWASGEWIGLRWWRKCPLMRGRQEALQSALSEENMKAQRKRREENKGRRKRGERILQLSIWVKRGMVGVTGVWTLSFPSEKIREALPQFSLISGELPEAPLLVCMCVETWEGAWHSVEYHMQTIRRWSGSLFFTHAHTHTLSNSSCESVQNKETAHWIIY